MDDSSGVFVLLNEYQNGGSVSVMLGLESARSDYTDLLTIARLLAETGHKVRILKAVHYKDPLYQIVFGDLKDSKYHRKCPDLIVDDYYVEYESYKTDNPRNALRNMLHHGLAQSDNLIIRKCNLTDGYMLRAIQGQIDQGSAVTRVWVFDGVGIRLLYKTEG